MFWRRTLKGALVFGTLYGTYWLLTLANAHTP